MTDTPKVQRRAAILASRRALARPQREAEAAMLADRVPDVVAGLAAPVTVCAYVPVGAEPGSAELLDRLRALCGRLLLPVVRVGPDGSHLPLDWGEYAPGRLEPGRFGLLEPAPPWLPAEAVASAAVVLVPALAVDRRGVRLGRGGGFYDRSLALCAPGTRLVAVVRDDEVVDELPAESHDVAMTHAFTPGSGLIRLGAGAARHSGSGT